MKVLFLDFDGVINTTRIYSEQRMIVHNRTWGKWLGLICPDRVALVDRVCVEAGAVVVVSSSWQYKHPLKQLQLMLRARGLTVAVVDTTLGKMKDPEHEHIVLADRRGKEIAKWLRGQPQVTHYAILDDMAEMGGGVAHALVRTYFDHGITENHVPTLLRLLGAEGGEDGRQ